MNSTVLLSILCNARKPRKFKMAAQNQKYLELTRRVYMTAAVFQRFPKYLRSQDLQRIHSQYFVIH